MAEGSERPEYLVVGRVVSVWGIGGEVRVEAVTDFPERFATGNTVFIGRRPFVIEGSRRHGKGWVLRLGNVDDMDTARAMRGRELEIPFEETQTLAEGQYYWFQIIGLQVYSTEGALLGEVVEVVPNPINDLYLVRGFGREFLVPAIEDVVKEIDIAAGKMTIEVLPGLI